MQRGAHHAVDGPPTGHLTPRIPHTAPTPARTLTEGRAFGVGAPEVGARLEDEMETFRDDNTEGFTAEQLDWANAQWRERHGDVDPDSDEGKGLQARILDEAALI